MQIALGVINQEVRDAADIKFVAKLVGGIDELIAVHAELLHLFKPRSGRRVT